MKAQSTIRRILGKAMSDGFKAGGIGFAPKTYFIAKNQKEERLLLIDSMPLKLGHMKRLEQLSENVKGISTRRIAGSRKMLEQWVGIEEKQLELEA